MKHDAINVLQTIILTGGIITAAGILKPIYTDSTPTRAVETTPEKPSQSKSSKNNANANANDNPALAQTLQDLTAEITSNTTHLSAQTEAIKALTQAIENLHGNLIQSSSTAISNTGNSNRQASQEGINTAIPSIDDDDEPDLPHPSQVDHNLHQLTDIERQFLNAWNNETDVEVYIGDNADGSPVYFTASPLVHITRGLGDWQDWYLDTLPSLQQAQRELIQQQIIELH